MREMLLLSYFTAEAELLGDPLRLLISVITINSYLLSMQHVADIILDTLQLN